jgi:hypothetical protein
VLGPKVAAKGVIRGGEVTQGQIAATVAGLVGEDYGAAVPKAAAPLPVIGTPSRASSASAARE